MNENRFGFFEKERGKKKRKEGKKVRELDLLYRVKYIGREKRKKKRGKERFKKCGGVL